MLSTLYKAVSKHSSVRPNLMTKEKLTQKDSNQFLDEVLKSLFTN